MHISPRAARKVRRASAKRPVATASEYHLGHRHRDSRYCQGTHRVEEVIGGHKVAHAGAADDIGKRHLEKGADELDDQG